MQIRCTRPIAILTYHQVDEPGPKGAPFRSLTVAPATFARQMDWMHRLGYRGLSMRALAPYLAGERSGKVFGLTFDDAYRNVYVNVLPVLARLGFTATTYVVSGQIDGTNAWDAALGVPQVPLMNADELLAWQQAGHEIGSHTVNHANLGELAPEAALQEMARARDDLRALAGTPVDAFCFPYGAHRPEQGALAGDAGYATAVTTRRGRVHAGADPLLLPRVPVLRGTGVLRLTQKCFTRYEDRRGGV